MFEENSFFFFVNRPNPMSVFPINSSMGAIVGQIQVNTY